MNKPRQMPAAVGHDGVVRIADASRGKKVQATTVIAARVGSCN
jgi:hypothetical protein